MEWRDVWRSLFPGRMIRPDVHEEISFHIEERVSELVRRGWEEDRARAYVIERFGDVASVEEACRTYDAQRVDGNRWRMTMDALRRDLRLAVRGVRKNPGFSAVVIVTLAIGIGATTAVFSVLEAVLLRPLPYDRPDRLAIVWQNDRATGTVREAASTSDYYDYVDRSRLFDDLAIYATGTAVLLREGAPPVQLDGATVSRNLLEVLGIDVQAGRGFTELEDQPGGPAVALLTDRAWRELFAGAPDIVGRTVSIDARSHEVIGVLPPAIDVPNARTHVWTPIQQSPATATRPQHWVTVVGRLADGATLAAAQEEMTRIMADLEVEYAADNANRGAFVEALPEVGRGDLAPTLWVLFASVLVVLAIACVNVANLLLARGAGRTRELAVLTAVGAGRGDVTRRFFVEGLVMTAVAGAGGVGLALGGVRLLTSLAPAGFSTLGTPAINVTVTSFALAVSAAVCLGFGLLPTLQLRRLDLQQELKEGRTSDGGGAGMALRRLMVAAQLAMAVVLLLGASLLIETVRNLRAVDPGFSPENALRADFALPDSRYPSFDTYPEWPEIFGFLRALEAEVEAVPGVRSVAVALNHPLDRGFTNSFRIEGQPYDPSQGEMTTRLVTPGYFESTGLRVLDGRALQESDRVETPPVLVLNRTAAARYFPQGDAIGRRIAFWGPTYREVVGIVADEKVHGLAADSPPAMYVSMYQSPPLGGKLTLMLRTEVPPLTLADPLRDAMRRVDPDVPVFDVATMEATLDEAMARERFASTLLSLFAGVAVFLAVLGVHGVLAYLVAQRGHEVGVRMALGATRRDVLAMIVSQGAMMTAVGIGAGLLAAVAVSGVLQRILFEVSATSPAAYAGVAVSLGVVALAATAAPAYRAASLDPVSSLRSE